MGDRFHGPRWTAPRTRRVLGTFAASVVAVGLVGCSPFELLNRDHVFTPPIVWDTTTSYLPGERVPDDVVVRLDEGGTAVLSGFPQGRSVQDDDGYFCIDELGEERYTGPATWEFRNLGSFFVRFDESEILVSADSRFGELDWTVTRFVACETEQEWDLGWVCGDSAYGGDGGAVFRDPCVGDDPS